MNKENKTILDSTKRKRSWESNNVILTEQQTRISGCAVRRSVVRGRKDKTRRDREHRLGRDFSLFPFGEFVSAQLRWYYQKDRARRRRSALPSDTIRDSLVFVLIVSSEVLGVWRHVASYVLDDALDDALVCCAARGATSSAFHGSCECCVSWCCWTIICHSEE